MGQRRFHQPMDTVLVRIRKWHIGPNGIRVLCGWSMNRGGYIVAKSSPSKQLTRGKHSALRFLEFGTLDVATFPSICAVAGADPFLRNQCMDRLKRSLLAGKDAEFSLTTFDGSSPTTTFKTVYAELATRSMFGGGRRLVVLEQADDFITKNRTELEDYSTTPKKSAILVLEPASFPATTRLAKTIEKEGIILDCAAPKEADALRWILSWAQITHRIRIETSAAELLLEMVGISLGLLDQELAKLALLTSGTESSSFQAANSTTHSDGSLPDDSCSDTSTNPTSSAQAASETNAAFHSNVVLSPDSAADPKSLPMVTVQMVEQLSGSWRTRGVWELLDRVLDGDVKSTLEQLERLLISGEHPIMILASAAATLRRFAAATRLVTFAQQQRRRISLRDALQEVGVKPFLLNRAESQLRRLGRPRAESLYTKLIEADLALKGDSRLDPRLIIERLFIHLAVSNEQQAKTNS